MAVVSPFRRAVQPALSRTVAEGLLVVACCFTLAAVGVCVAGIAGRGDPQFLDALAFALLAGGGIATLGCVLARLTLPDEAQGTRACTPRAHRIPSVNAAGRGVRLANEAVIVLLAWISIPLWIAIAYQSYFLTDVPQFSRGLLNGIAQQLEALAPPWSALTGFVARLASTPIESLDRREYLVPFLMCFAAVSAVYLAVLLLLPHLPTVSRKLVLTVVGLPIIAQLILGAGPALLSADVVSYAAYGHLAGLDGINPYLTAPSAFPADPFMAFVTGNWSSQTSVYGPVWNDISAALSRLFSTGDLVPEVLAYRAFASIVQVANLWLFWLLLNHWPTTRGLNLSSRLARWTLLAWNPNLLIEVGQSAHNDVLIISSIIVSLLALAPSPGQSSVDGRDSQTSTAKVARWMGAVISLVAGALVKFVPLVLIPLSGLAFWLGVRTWKEALRIGALTGVVGILVFLLPSIHWMSGADVLAPFRTALQGGPVTTNDLAHEPALWITARFLDKYSEHVQQSRDAAASWISAGLLLSFVAYAVVELAWLLRFRRTPSRALEALPGVGARFLTFFILLVLHQVRSWYFIWAIPLAGVVAPRSVTSTLVVLIGLCAFPSLMLISESIWPGGFLLMVQIAFPASVALLLEASGHLSQWRIPAMRPSPESAGA
jgi:hypothetical protein